MNYSSQNNPQLDRLSPKGDRYHILKCLSIGKTAEVYLVKNIRLDRLVVLKLLKVSLGESEETYRRWKREVELCASFENEYVAKILDLGTTPKGYPFYVMEYFKGESLEQLLKREQRLTVDRSVNIVKQLCEGLQLAHTGVILNNKPIGIVHGNLKLDNVFLTVTASGESVKILDCGITKKTHDLLSKYECKDTATKNIVPDILYVAPEQIIGLSEINRRTDIYSLGIAFYRMLSGTNPFGLSLKKSPIDDRTWAKAHISQPPQSLRSLPGCEQISPQLENVVLKCLRKSPDARFTSMAELKQALERAIIVSPTNLTPANSNNTIVQSPSLPINLDNPTIPRQILPIPEPKVLKQPTAVVQSHTNPTPNSAARTIYQGTVAPQRQPAKPNQTIYQGITSSRQNDVPKIYKKRSLLQRLQKIPLFSSTRIIRSLIRKIKLWIRRHRPRF